MSLRHHDSPINASEKPALIERTRRAILVNGRNATAYQIINRGILRWFYPQKDREEDALVGFVCSAKTGVAAGEPVCRESAIRQTTEAFQQFLHQKGMHTVCWFCATPIFAESFRNDSRYASILIGAQPVWDPRQWASEIRKHSTLRKQLNRAINKGVSVSEWTTGEATNHPDLLRCLHEWLEARPFPPLHFLVEPQTLDRLFDRRVFVAQRDGEAIGFVVLSPIPRQNGWLVEQIIRGQGAPNGTAELMVDHAAQTLGSENCSYLTLGLAPLSKRAGIPSANPRWIRFLLGWVRLHGRRFYNFDGLDYFKAKFIPQYWEPVYAVVNRPRFTLGTFYAIATAFSNGSPLRALAVGSWKAIRQELRWLSGWLRSVRD